MTTAAFLSALTRNAARIRAYRLGGDGSDGGCDCIGLIIGAVRLAGENWPGIHGSNWAARCRTEGLAPIADPAALCPGDIVYKVREPGEPKYALPDTYRTHADRRDYYHVGVVTQNAPLVITHCSAGGIHRDGALGAWAFAGRLKGITDGGPSAGAEAVPAPSDAPQESSFPPESAVVYAPDGNPVRLRLRPDPTAPWLCRIPVGRQVTLMRMADDVWAQVRTERGDGYMMRAFLHTPSGSEWVPVRRSDLQRARDALNRYLVKGEDLHGKKLG